ncbi:MAG: hypothetical protein WCW56_00030 [Candidatus Paceibacterota bacterium]|jgi:hypothetical protein
MTTATAIQKGLADLDFARSLFVRGTECLGSDEIAKTFGVSVAPAPEDIPPIPFTEEELMRARELGQFLILCGPVSMAEMNKVLDNKLCYGKLLYDTDWYQGENFYLQEKADWHWRLVTREVIPGSAGQNYLQQTRTIAKYLVDKVYVGQELPSRYAEAIAELDWCEDELTELMKSDWKKAAEQLVTLKLNQRFRETPAQVLWSVALFKKINHEYLLPSMYTWTNQRSSGGYLVHVGYADADGVRVYFYDPRNSDDCLGVRFSRSALDLES